MSDSASARASCARVLLQFDHVGNRGVEFADAILLALVLAFEIVADGLEDQRDAGRRVLEVGGQRRGVAGAGSAGGIAVVIVLGGGASARQREFRVDHPDEALGGEQRERARVVQDFGERELAEIVLAHRVRGHACASSASLMRRRS